MHDTNLLQLITDDFAPAQRLLALLQTESLALHGRDMPLLEEILAEKQALIILLEQHGRKRSEILASLNLPLTRAGLEQLAQQVARPWVKGFAGRRQPGLARGAFEQWRLQLGFQLFDLSAKGRLRHKQAFGGGAEAAAVGDFDEVAQLASGNHASCLFEMSGGL